MSLILFSCRCSVSIAMSFGPVRGVNWFNSIFGTFSLFGSCTDVTNICSDPYGQVIFDSGLFATVRKCKHKETGIMYAAKFSSRVRYGADCSLEILHEISMLSVCVDSNRIVHLKDVFQNKREIILVLEYAPGGDFQSVLDEDMVPFEDDARGFLRQILEGLEFIHDKSIAHLDIKPQNIVLMGQFPNCEIKLCDLEVARIIQKDVEIREIIGTPEYVAPEILTLEPISLAADIWSLGVVAYVLLTGFSPFGGDTDQETLRNITSANLDFPDELFEGVSEEAKNFVAICLNRDPRKRPTVRECLQHGWIANEAEPPSPSPLMLKIPALDPIYHLTPSNNHLVGDESEGGQDKGPRRSCKTCRDKTIERKRYLSKSREAIFGKVANSKLKKSLSKSRERVCDMSLTLSKSRDHLNDAKSVPARSQGHLSGFQSHEVSSTHPGSTNKRSVNGAVSGLNHAFFSKTDFISPDEPSVKSKLSSGGKLAMDSKMVSQSNMLNVSDQSENLLLSASLSNTNPLKKNDNCPNIEEKNLQKKLQNSLYSGSVNIGVDDDAGSGNSFPSQRGNVGEETNANNQEFETWMQELEKFRSQRHIRVTELNGTFNRNKVPVSEEDSAVEQQKFEIKNDLPVLLSQLSANARQKLNEINKKSTPSISVGNVENLRIQEKVVDFKGFLSVKERQENSDTEANMQKEVKDGEKTVLRISLIQKMDQRKKNWDYFEIEPPKDTSEKYRFELIKQSHTETNLSQESQHQAEDYSAESGHGTKSCSHSVPLAGHLVKAKSGQSSETILVKSNGNGIQTESDLKNCNHSSESPNMRSSELSDLEWLIPDEKYLEVRIDPITSQVETFEVAWTVVSENQSENKMDSKGKKRLTMEFKLTGTVKNQQYDDGFASHPQTPTDLKTP